LKGFLKFLLDFLLGVGDGSKIKVVVGNGTVSKQAFLLDNVVAFNSIAGRTSGG